MANHIITKDKSKTDLARYLHVTVFLPALDTLEKTIAKGIFVSWHGIRELNFIKLLEPTLTTKKWHIDPERKNGLPHVSKLSMYFYH